MDINNKIKEKAARYQKRKKNSDGKLCFTQGNTDDTQFIPQADVKLYFHFQQS